MPVMASDSDSDSDSEGMQGSTHVETHDFPIRAMDKMETKECEGT